MLVKHSLTGDTVRRHRGPHEPHESLDSAAKDRAPIGRQFEARCNLLEEVEVGLLEADGEATGLFWHWRPPFRAEQPAAHGRTAGTDSRDGEDGCS